VQRSHTGETGAIRAPTRIVLAALVVTLAGAACQPGGAAREATAPPAPASTGVTETGPVTLTVWDQESGLTSKVWDQLTQEFEDRYPNVTVDRVHENLDELKTLLRLALSGPNAPDVVEANQGWPEMGQLVKAGLLLPLDNYATAYGWRDRVSQNVLAVSSWTSDGKNFGTGSLYGYTAMGELIGVYYNKQKLADLGLAVPTTFDEFEHDLDVAKQAGEIAIQFADNDAWPGIHEYAVVQDQLAQKDYLSDFIFGRQRDQLSFATPENVQAATTLQDWANAGYFTPGFLGAGYDSSLVDYANGEGVFMITGNWAVANIGADSTEFGFFLMPPQTAGSPPVSTGGAGYPLAISSSTDHADTAAAYIDWMNSDHASDLLVHVGQLPLNSSASTSDVPPGTLLADVLDAAANVTEGNGVVPYEDWATPTFYDTLTAAIQELVANRLSPQQFVDKVQGDYSDFQSSRT
jgi:raffinose/stachyose/melibiose transport system substrate-binding protein